MPYFTRTTYLSALIASLSCVSQASSAQEFYKWIDSKGSTHYTTTPPPKNAKKLSKVDTYGSRQSNAVKTASPSPTAQNNTTPTAPVAMDAQQQEANAALQQGRNKR